MKAGATSVLPETSPGMTAAMTSGVAAIIEMSAVTRSSPATMANKIINKTTIPFKLN
jgi:hypothetical protein